MSTRVSQTINPLNQVSPNSPRTKSNLKQLNRLIELTGHVSKNTSIEEAETLAKISDFINNYFDHKLKITLQVNPNFGITYVDSKSERIAVCMPKKLKQKVVTFLKKNAIEFSENKRFNRILKTNEDIVYRLSETDQTDIFLNPANMIKLLKLIKTDAYSLQEKP